MSGVQVILAICLAIGLANCALLRMPLHRDDDALQNKYGSQGSVELINIWGGLRYYGYVSVGTPAQRFEARFDTRSALSWVKSSKCSLRYSACAFMVPKFDDSKSTTYQSTASEFTYSKPVHISGSLGYDTIRVGNLTVPAQKFGEVINLDDDDFIGDFYDAVVGLARKSSDNTPTVFDGMVKNGLIDEAVFSIYINRNRTHKSGGEILFGGTNPNHYQGEITYVPLISDDEWVVPLNAVQTGSTTVGNGGYNAVIDTTTQWIHGPTKEIAAINEAIGAAAFYDSSTTYYVNCSIVNDLPSVKIILDKREFVLEGNDYVDTNGSAEHAGFCWTTFVENPKEDRWVLGYSFLGRYYSIFDPSNDRIGFAKSK